MLTSKKPQVVSVRASPRSVKQHNSLRASASKIETTLAHLDQLLGQEKHLVEQNEIQPVVVYQEEMEKNVITLGEAYVFYMFATGAFSDMWSLVNRYKALNEPSEKMSLLTKLVNIAQQHDGELNEQKQNNKAAELFNKFKRALNSYTLTFGHMKLINQ